MKMKIAIVAAALFFMVGCETTGNTTGSTSSNSNVGTTPATAGTSTSGATNPATTSTNARSTLTEGSTAAGSGTTTNTSAATATGTTVNGTTSNANNANVATQSGPPATNNPMNQTSAGVNNATSAGTAGAFAVPPSHQSAFSTRYPGASNVQWSRYNSTDVPIDWELTDWTKLDNDDYVVRYHIGTDPYYSWYDSDGNWVGTSVAMKNTSGLPAAINTMLASKYKGYTISSANTEYWKDRTAYEIEMSNATTKVKLLVDANGNVIKEKTKTQ